jgi:protein O-GlcNAc transferase
MEPHMAANDKRMFYKYLDKASKYFEWGSGGSTYAASCRSNIVRIVSVESDKNWYMAVRTAVPRAELRLVDLLSAPNTWGRPGPSCPAAAQKQYSNELLEVNEPHTFDLILIDGRYRVACCLKAFQTIRDDCLIIFDDFLDRPAYHVVLDYYTIVEQTSDIRMVILKKRIDVMAPSAALIEKYERDPC